MGISYQYVDLGDLALGDLTLTILCTDRTGFSLLQDSSLNMNRFSNVARYLHPREDFNVTGASLNELLANVTISALSLGAFKDLVPVEVKEFQNTYHFSDKVGFVVPYALCLLFATVFAALAIRSLNRNGVPAADGSFLQIMMATRGDTEMERLVIKEGDVGVDQISSELKQLKVKLGEHTFTDAEDGKVRQRLTFQTAEEGSSYIK